MRKIFLNILKYIISIPLALITGQIVYWFVYFLWKWFYFINPIRLFNFFHIEILDKIENFIDWYLCATLVEVFSSFAFIYALYYLLPKNRYRQKIIYGVVIIFTIMMIIAFIRVKHNGYEIYENLCYLFSTFLFAFSLDYNIEKEIDANIKIKDIE